LDSGIHALGVSQIGAPTIFIGGASQAPENTSSIFGEWAIEYMKSLFTHRREKVAHTRAK
jgi:hypothetical protein